MAKHFEALQRAEAERKRKAGVESPDSPPSGAEWDSSSLVPGDARRKGIRRLLPSFKKDPVEAVDDSANELNKRRISILQPESFASEQFRMLRGRIDALATQQRLCSVAVTSANPREGKSMASVNLAVVTGMSVGRRVLLIDCDLRRPKIHKTLGIEAEYGLAEVVQGECSFEEGVQSVGSLGIDVLPVCALPGNPSELLASAQMKETLTKACESYDHVILDTPACLGLSDTKTISELSDGILVVVRADVTRREDVDAIMEILDRRKMIGMVLNDVEPTTGQRGYY